MPSKGKNTVTVEVEPPKAGYHLEFIAERMVKVPDGHHAEVIEPHGIVCVPNGAAQLRNPVAEFDEQHNKSGPSIVDDVGWVRWSDGAYREPCREGQGLLKSPSKDPYKRAKDIVLYWRFRVRYAEERLQNAEQSLLNRAKAIATDGARDDLDQTDIQKVRVFKAVVRTMQKHLAKAERVLKRHEPPHLKNRRMEMKERRERGSKLLQEVQDLLHEDEQGKGYENAEHAMAVQRKIRLLSARPKSRKRLSTEEQIRQDVHDELDVRLNRPQKETAIC